MQRMATNGTIAGAVSISITSLFIRILNRNKADINGANIDLLKLCLENLDNYDWSFK